MDKIIFSEEIKGDRVVLKKHPLTFKHAEEIFEIIDRNREEFAILRFPEFTHRAEDSFTGFLMPAEQRWKESTKLEYMIELNGVYIGNISAFDFNYIDSKVEIGYWLDNKYTGHGYMTEAVKVLENYLFDNGFNRIQIIAAIENTASINVAKRCDYQEEGYIRDFRLVQGKYLDAYLFSKLKSDR